jgi:hypothetical protein
VPHDAFISYSTEDKEVANAVCHRMEAAGVRCWIAPRDVQTGATWDDAVVEAMLHAKIVLLVFSAAANNSRAVRNEVVAALEANKIVFPFRIENVAPTGGLHFHLSRLHWLDAMTPPLEAHIDYLVENAKRVLSGGSPEPAPALPRQPPTPPPPIPAKTARSPLFLVIGTVAATALALVLGVGIYEVAQRQAPIAAPAQPSAPVTIPPAPAPTPAPAPIPDPAPILAPTPIPIAPPTTGFLFANSDRRLLTPGDLTGLSCAQLDIARNEIYARLGRAFQRPDLQRYFSQFPWYQPSPSNPVLNSTEQANVSLLSQAEASNSCRR